MTTTVAEKADRLVREGHVEILNIRSFEQWDALVEGDTSTYVVGRDPERRWCDCAHGVRSFRPCSHFLAAEMVVAARLDQQLERSSA